MRYIALILALVISTGCRTTHVVEADWQDEEVVAGIESFATAEEIRAHLPPYGSVMLRDLSIDGDTISGVWSRRSSSIRMLLPSSQVSVDSVSGATTLKFHRRQVADLQYRKNGRRGAAAFAGAAIGVGVGVAISFLPGSDNTNELGRQLSGIVGIPIGGLLGLMVGLPKNVVYRFNADSDFDEE